MPAASSVANVFAATPGWLFIPAPTSDTFPRSSRAVHVTPSESSTRSASGRSSTGAEKTISGPVCTIVSTLMLASASAPNSRAADVVDGLLALMHDSGDQRLLEHLLVLLTDPRALGVVERRADMEPHSVAARDLDRAGCHHARARGRHLEHFLE